MSENNRRYTPEHRPAPRRAAGAQGAPMRRPASSGSAPRHAAPAYAMRTGASRRREAMRRKRQRRMILYIGIAVVVLALIVLLIVLLTGKPADDPAVPASALLNLESPAPTETALERAMAALPGTDEVPATEAPTVEPTATPEPVKTTGVDSVSSDPVRAARASTRVEQKEGFLPVLTSANTEEKIIAITVDDCFQVNNLKKILELVMQYDGKITLFPIGEQAMRETHQPVIKAAWEAGMEIENHTYTHNGLYKCGDEELAREIYVQNYALSYILGGEYKCHFLRPRGGDARWDQRIHAYCEQQGYYGIAHWSVSGRSSTVINELAPGAIFLFHTTDTDLKVLRELIPAAAAAGYKMVTLNEMFGYDDNEFTPCEISRDMPEVPQLQPYEEVLVTLKKGTYSHTVYRIQERLKELGYTRDDPDACFGDNTKSAVMAFQKKAGLDADGIAGPDTQRALFADSAPHA